MIGILIVTHKELAEALISVWDLILGRQERMVAVSLDPNASPEVSRRIREMGFCEDQRVKCLSQQCMMICQVCNARLGLSEQLAKAILVEPEPGLREAS